MAKKPSSFPGLKYLFPSYYLRRPHRLGFVSLVFVVLFFLFMDRQNQARELEALSSRIQELEGEKGVLIAQLNSQDSPSRREGSSHKSQGQQQQQQQRQDGVAGKGGGSVTASQGQQQDPSSGVKADPLILGVGVGGGARKLLPKREEAKAAEGQTVAQAGQQSEQASQQAEHSQQSQGSQQSEQVLQTQQTQQIQQGQQSQGLEGAEQAQGQTQAQAQAQVQTQSPVVLKGEVEDNVAEQRRESIWQGMAHAWAGYVKYAWGEDELQPLSQRGVSNFGHMGATIVDSLDTLFIMGLTTQFNQARNWVATELSFNKDYTCSVFETTIRLLGGLLSAYDLSGDSLFLTKARELADRLLPAWNTPSGVPWNHLNLRSGSGDSPGWAGGSTVLADAGTTQVEMIALTQRTNDSRYAAKSEGVIRAIDKVFPPDGLCPYYISPHTGTFTGSTISFGAMGDSFYEYLLKVWFQGGKTPVVKRYREMWEISIKGMMDRLVRHTDNGFTYVAELHGGGIMNKMDHLLCFVPGMLSMGARDADDDLAEQYMNLAKELTKTCYEFYHSQPSKLSGENYNFHSSGMSVGQSYNIGRPETVEALFYLWRATKDPIYREWGWNIWQAFEMKCRVEAGYTGLRDVAVDPPPKDDMMQSFFLAETLKYLYLLFSPDDVIPLDQWVFNTEAHPVKIIPRHQPF